MDHRSHPIYAGGSARSIAAGAGGGLAAAGGSGSGSGQRQRQRQRQRGSALMRMDTGRDGEGQVAGNRGLLAQRPAGRLPAASASPRERATLQNGRQEGSWRP